MSIQTKSFSIQFKDGNTAQAYRISPDSDTSEAIVAMGLTKPRPTIFITGGASYMSDEDAKRTRRIIDEGVARFAADNGITLIDGGTESGVMQIIGDSRRIHQYRFPLIGVAPIGKVSYPGMLNPNSEAELEDSHSHFLLVESDNWGDESSVIIQLTRKLSGMGQYPVLGILINGGKIARQDVLLATTQGKNSIPILVVEGSGRFADELATAFRTGKTNQAILKAIIDGGDIELVATIEGPEAIRSKLSKRFGTRK